MSKRSFDEFSMPPEGWASSSKQTTQDEFLRRITGSAVPSAVQPKVKLDQDSLFDVLILGAGPAGLSAALALCRVKRTAAVFSSDGFRNDPGGRTHTVITKDNSAPNEIRAAGRADIEKYGTTLFVERAITGARYNRQTKAFEVIDVENQPWRGRKLILATGSSDVFPQDIDGYAENWGSNIYPCLFCNGLERGDRPAGVLGFSSAADLHSVSVLLQLGCPSVTIFTNGPVSAEASTAEALKVAKHKGAKVEQRPIGRLVHAGGDNGVDIVFRDKTAVRLGFLVHKPATVANGASVSMDLGIEIVSDGMGGTIVVRNEPFGETNVPGVFSAGDVNTSLKQMTTAMYHGVLAGIGAHQQITMEDDDVIARGLRGCNVRLLRQGMDAAPALKGAQP